jgi:DNA-binding response OmpR family regulator
MVVLLADDNRLLLSVLANVLRLGGHDVLAADSGDKALRLLRQLRPDCAILDLYMPSVSGEEVARHCRALEIPFLFLTAYDDLASRGVARDLGAREYMVKPATGHQLLAALARCGGNPAQPSPRA